MKIKVNKHLYALIAIFLVTMGLYLWLVTSPYLSSLIAWTQQHILIFSLSLLLLKIAGIIYPPLPGGLATLASVPLLGWQLAYSIDFIGSMIGSTCAFFIARKYGYSLLSQIFDAKTIQKIHRIKVSPGKEVETIFILRVLLGSTLMEAVCYGAGLLPIKYNKFLTGSILSHLTIGIPTYYLVDNIIELEYLFLTLGLVAVGLVLFWKFRRRYFSYD